MADRKRNVKAPTKIYMHTKDLARAVNVHPNTIRLYEQWGYLPAIPRSPSGYRLFTEEHLVQMQLARLTLSQLAVKDELKRTLQTMLYEAAAGYLDLALKLAYAHMSDVQLEQRRAKSALLFLQQGAIPEARDQPLSISQAAEIIGVPAYLLRTWEQYGFFQAPRHPHKRYRVYDGTLLGRLFVVRMLRQSGYRIEAALRLLHKFDLNQDESRNQHQEQNHPADTLLTIAESWQITLHAHEIRVQQIIDQLKTMLDTQQSRAV